MTLDEMLHALKETALSQEIGESDWLFPGIETVHVIALTLVVGSIAFVDLRLVGLVARQRAPRALLTSLLPTTWGAFVVAVITGVLLFTAKPVTYAENTYFLVKLALIAAAGVNMALFHLVVQRRIDLADAHAHPDPWARATGLASLLLWTGVIACGRWIGFTV